MVALDQRPPLFEAIAQAKGIAKDQVEYADVTAAKRLLVEALSPHCSSMLFDPNFAVPAAIDLLPARCGLILTLEEHRVEETVAGRRSRSIDRLERGQDSFDGRRCGQGAGLVPAGCRSRDQRASEAVRARDRRATARKMIFHTSSNCLSIRSSAAPTIPPTMWNPRQTAVARDRERARIRQAGIWRRSIEA